jgi:ABC-type Fe3+-hydroxamate transport system substrate-binding protein
MLSLIDQLGNEIQLPCCPRRIVSLVPSITELLHDLHLEKEVVGITKFCVRPAHWFLEKRRVGGTKKLMTSSIAELGPELIIANKEENTLHDVEILQKVCPVWISDVKTLDDALIMIASVGKLCCRTSEADKLIQKIKSAFQHLRELPAFNTPPVSAAYLIWRNPYMIAGTDTFISNMMGYCNLRNAFSESTRYPTIDITDLRSSDCRLILVSSEPYPFKQDHIKDLEDALPGKQIMFVDGEMFSWYGSRLTKAALYFEKILRDIHKARVAADGE